jgi:uncharacterized alpha-E superfamily protein
VDVHHQVLSVGTPHLEIVVETGIWLSILRSCSGWEPYMKRHRGRVNGPSVAAFLVLEPAFPRSVRHAVSAAKRRLQSLCPPTVVLGQKALERLDKLDETLTVRDPESLGASHELATYVVAETTAICAAINTELFGYAPMGASA